MIKRIIALLFLFTLLNVIIFVGQDKATPVFNYLDIDLSNEGKNYDIYTLSFNDININTNNFDNYFNKLKLKILGIYPEINSLYVDKLKTNINYFAFTNKDNSNNIEKFTLLYFDILSSYGFSNEIEKTHFNGIKIAKVKMYTSIDVINKLVSKYPSITYTRHFK